MQMELRCPRAVPPADERRPEPAPTTEADDALGYGLWPAWLAGPPAGSLPDFLVISPPKTGSTWLAANLACHPQVFIPAVKEVKYFSSYSRWLDLHWYARQFRDAGGRLKGEATPSYSVLPCRTIRLIRALLPRVKLVFLMRDPVARAWSHARHNYVHHEANFRQYASDLDAVRAEEWRANFRHPWPLLSGDYLGQLRRWLAVFPREQIFVDCYERIATDPAGLLRAVLDFLGASTDVDWSSFRLRETILPGRPRTLPADLQADLRLLLRERTAELEAFLQDRFGLSVRGAWPETQENGPGRRGSEAPAAAARALFARASDDDYLTALLDVDLDPAYPRRVEVGYHGYDLVLYRGRFFAVPESPRDPDPVALDEAAARPGTGVRAGHSLQEVREQVIREVLRGMQEGQALFRRELEARLQQQEARLAECQAFVARVRNALPFRVRRAVAEWFRRWTRRA